MNVIVNHIPETSKKRPGKVYAKYDFNPQYITLHNTGNPSSTALNERLWLTNLSNTTVTGWHYVIDEKNVIEAIPPTELAFHAGNFKGNNESIGIEICESGNQEKVLTNVVEFVAKMLYDRGWEIDRIRQHFDWSGKDCPRLLRAKGGIGWNKLMNDIERRLKEMNETKNSLVEATQHNFVFNYEGNRIEIDSLMSNNTNYVPARLLADILGFKMNYNSKTKITDIVKK